MKRYRVKSVELDFKGLCGSTDTYEGECKEELIDYVIGDLMTNLQQYINVELEEV